MSKRSQLNADETLGVMRFVADVAAHKADPLGQRQFLIDGLQERVDAAIGFAYSGEGWLPGMRPALLSSVVTSTSPGPFSRYIADVLIPQTVVADPYCARTVDRRDRLVNVGRRDVMPDRDAERAFDAFVGWGHDFELGDGAVCFSRLDDARGTIFGVGLHRRDRARRAFGELNRQRVALVVAECAALIDRGHLRLPELDGAALDPMAGLSPRLREVLGLMLKGEHPKAIARTLELSVWTVREYVNDLYRHYDVHGRDELMARFVA